MTLPLQLRSVVETQFEKGVNYSVAQVFSVDIRSVIRVRIKVMIKIGDTDYQVYNVRTTFNC